MCLSFSPSLWISKELIESQLRIGTFLHGLQEAQRGTHEPRRFEKWKMVFGDLVPPVMAQKTGKFKTYWLVVSTYPSEKWWSSSVGMVIPNIWKHKSHAPNHQPAYLDQSIIIIHLNSWAIIQFPFTARCFSNPSKSSLNHQEITIKSHETCPIFPNPIPEWFPMSIQFPVNHHWIQFPSPDLPCRRVLESCGNIGRCLMVIYWWFNGDLLVI